MDAKEELKEIFNYCIYKLDNNLCTMEEIENGKKVLAENLNLNGTIEDLSNYFGLPESHIRATIARKLLAKPKRRVYYSFNEFLKIVPKGWKGKRK